MIFLALLFASAIDDSVARLPRVVEPDWNTWRDVEAGATKRATEAWKTLCSHTPQDTYDTPEERAAAEANVNAAYQVLEANSRAACAAGAALLRSSENDWERLMIATAIHELDSEAGEPFLLWTMATAKSVDDAFEPVFEFACHFAERRRKEYLPAMFAVLRTRDGHVYLPDHSWYIRTHEVMFYVFGRYGREALPHLHASLSDEDPYVRRNAAFAIGFFVDRSAEGLLMKVLKKNDAGSGGAAFALSQLGVEAAVKPISDLLKNTDARTRFWAAYALHELGMKEALPALEAAAAAEKDDNTRREIKAAIDHLRADIKPLGADARKLDKESLRKELTIAEQANGLMGDIEAIALSATRDELEQLERIRLKSMTVHSDRGNKRFRKWTEVIKVIYHRER